MDSPSQTTLNRLADYFTRHFEVESRNGPYNLYNSSGKIKLTIKSPEDAEVSKIARQAGIAVPQAKVTEIEIDLKAIAEIVLREEHLKQ